jgi:hypothetical protein
VKFNIIHFDDDAIIPENKSYLTTDFSIKKIFTTDPFFNKSGSLYRPLQNISFALDAYLADSMAPKVFHRTNVILFLLIGIFQTGKRNLTVLQSYGLTLFK